VRQDNGKRRTDEHLYKLTGLIERLRGNDGCPWDRQQTPKTLTIYLIEEVYELVEAISALNSAKAVCEELGDVLFHVLFIAHMFAEKGHFDIGDVIDANVEKMIRRHPHVFSDAVVESASDVRRRWVALKRQEHPNGPRVSLLDSIPTGLPALIRAYRISERAARAGFDWENLSGVMEKTEEEWREFKSELTDRRLPDQSTESAALEFGDILFTLVNVARFARIHPESALSEATRKFEKRFRYMEKRAAEDGRAVDELDRDRLEALWEEAKRVMHDGASSPS
jgi:tetrapyrrole methylase family protein/MazG family protein